MQPHVCADHKGTQQQLQVERMPPPHLQLSVPDRAQGKERCASDIPAESSYSGPQIKGCFTEQWALIFFKMPRRNNYGSQKNEELVRQADTKEAHSSLASFSYWGIGSERQGLQLPYCINLTLLSLRPGWRSRRTMCLWHTLNLSAWR